MALDALQFNTIDNAIFVLENVLSILQQPNDVSVCLNRFIHSFVLSVVVMCVT